MKFSKYDFFKNSNKEVELPVFHPENLERSLALAYYPPLQLQYHTPRLDLTV